MLNSPFGQPYDDQDDREQHADEAEEWRERFAEADRLFRRIRDLEQHCGILLKCMENTDPKAFRNGNTEYGVDEGEVLTRTAMDRARAALAPQPQPEGTT